MLIVGIEIFTSLKFADALVNWALDLIVVGCYYVSAVFSKRKNSKRILSRFILIYLVLLLLGKFGGY